MDEKEILSLIINNLPGNIYWKDLQGRHLGCNLSNALAAGLSHPDEIIGKTDFELSWKDRAEQIVASDLEVIKTQEKVVTEDRIILPGDTHESVFLSQKMPLYEHGEVSGTIGVSQDITELKETQSKLEKALEDAKAADKAKTAVVHNLRHDWLTPFCGIYSLNESLAATEEDPEKSKLLFMARDSAKVLLDHTNSILNMISAMDGLPNLQEKIINVHDIVNNVYKSYRPEAFRKKIDFHIDNQTNAVDVLGDDYRLERVIMTLVSNAIKFTGDEGTVHLSLSSTPVGDDKVEYKFSIKDTGIGMDDAKVKQIYEPLYRGYPAYEAIYSGAGTGLTIAKQYIKDMGGQIACDSKESVGTKFVVCLTLKRSNISSDEVKL